MISSAVESCGRKRFRMAASRERRTHWLNQDVKKAIRTRKDVFKALLQNRSSSGLKSRYSEARKAGALAVKLFKERSWEKFGHRLDSNIRWLTKYFFRPFSACIRKSLSTTISIQDSTGGILWNEKEIL